MFDMKVRLSRHSSTHCSALQSLSLTEKVGIKMIL